MTDARTSPVSTSPGRFVLDSSIGSLEFVPNDAFKQLPAAEQAAAVEDLKSSLGVTLYETAEHFNPKSHDKDN